MAHKLSYQDVLKQSNAVFNQFGKRWQEFAKINAKIPNRRPVEELRNCGVGKALVSVAMGESLEGKIEILKKYRDKVDIIVCDKGFGFLLDRGIKADYVMLCDTNIVYDKWLKKYINDTKGVKLISTPYGNTDWTTRWQGPVYFYVNKDAIESEKIFIPIMGDTRVIPASSNVSNAQVVFMTGFDEWDQVNFSGYDRFFLIGYDYSWRPKGNYYAWKDPKPKRFYQHHRTSLDIRKDIVFSSENLVFSARWLSQYITGWNIPAINCSGRGLLECIEGDFEEQLKCVHTENSLAVKLAFKAVKAAKVAFDETIKMFEESRRNLIWQSVMKLKRQ